MQSNSSYFMLHSKQNVLLETKLGEHHLNERLHSHLPNYELTHRISFDKHTLKCVLNRNGVH